MESLALGHPLWTPPALCKRGLNVNSLTKYPGNNFCPPIRVVYFRKHMAQYSPPAPSDYWMLDAPALMAIIAEKSTMSKWVVNIGADPSSTGENGERVPIVGDDVSALWFMGYRGVNFDIPENEASMKSYYGKWPQAVVDTRGLPPIHIADALRQHYVPNDIDFLKIDVDSFDCEFLDEILKAGYLPKAISIESAPYWPPPLKFITRFSSDHPYADARPSPMMGCSLSMVLSLLEPYNYTLIQFVMEDAWLVKGEFAGLFGLQDFSPTDIFKLGNPNLYAAHQFKAPEGKLPKDLLEELIALRPQPEKMLEKAQQMIEDQLELTPSLRRVKYELSV